MNKLIKKQKYLHLTLVIIALTGIIFPLINIRLHLIGQVMITFSLTSLLQNSDIMQSTIDSANEANFISMSFHLILPFITYLLSSLLLISSLILIALNKFKSIVIFLSMTTTTLLIYTGISLHSPSNMLIQYLENILVTYIDGSNNLFTHLMDFPNLLEIHLGAGYWITLIASATLLIIVVITKIIQHIKRSVKYSN
jgi:hypothetical protein